MRGMAAAFAALLAMFGCVALVAAAEVGTTADELEFRGYFVERGAEGDVNDLERLVVDARQDGNAWYFVSLADDPPGGNDAFAEQLQQRVSTPGTVYVVSPSEVGAVSSDFDDAAINRALDESSDDLRRSFNDGAEALVESLQGRGSGGGGSDGGSGGLAVLLVPLLGILGIGALFVWFARRKSRKRTGEYLDVARKEISEQLDAVAHGMVDHSERVELSDDSQVEEYYRAASATYEEARAELEAADSLGELAQISHRVDRARWQLDAVAALLDGKEVPPEPSPEKPAACFFDPTHAPGTEPATISTAAGDKEVRVCPMDAEKLRRGEHPEPRKIEVGGRRVPAGMAPTSHGGLGMGGLGPFSIILGGLAQAMSFDWGGQAPSRRPRRPGGTFGPDILPGGGVFGPRGGSPRGGFGRRSSRTIGRGRRRR